MSGDVGYEVLHGRGAPDRATDGVVGQVGAAYGIRWLPRARPHRRLLAVLKGTRGRRASGRPSDADETPAENADDTYPTSPSTDPLLRPAIQARRDPTGEAWLTFRGLLRLALARSVRARRPTIPFPTPEDTAITTVSPVTWSRAAACVGCHLSYGTPPPCSPAGSRSGCRRRPSRPHPDGRPHDSTRPRWPRSSPPPCRFSPGGSRPTSRPSSSSRSVGPGPSRSARG